MTSMLVVLPSELLVWAAVIALPVLLVVLVLVGRRDRRDPPDDDRS
jgi:hypothetical protein